MFKHKTHHQAGFAGLLSLLIATALIGFFMYSYLGKTGTSSSQSETITTGDAISTSLSSGGKRSVADNTFIISALQAVRTNAQMYSIDHGDYNGFCTANSGGPQSTFASIAQKIPGGLGDITCTHNSDAFAVSVKTGNGSYICTDSTGYISSSETSSHMGTSCSK
jgi:hypothetical protein